MASTEAAAAAPLDNSSTAVPSVASTSAAMAASTTSSAVAAAVYRSTLDTTPRKVMVSNVMKFMKPKEVQKLITSWMDEAAAFAAAAAAVSNEAPPSGNGHADPTAGTTTTTTTTTSTSTTIAGPTSSPFHIEKYKKPPRNPWITITLAHEAMVAPFLQFINTETHSTNKKGKAFTAKRVMNDNENAKTTNKRSRQDEDEDDEETAGEGSKTHHKRRRRDDSRRPEIPACPTAAQIRDKLTPFWSCSYEDQLKTKRKDLIKDSTARIVKTVKQKFKTLHREARNNPDCIKKVPNEYAWLRNANRRNTTTPEGEEQEKKAKEAVPAPRQQRGIYVEAVIPSPQIMKYRNKCELTFGYRSVESETETMEEENGKKKLSKMPSVGFLPFGWRHAVCQPHGLQNIPDAVCGIAEVVEDFLQRSTLSVYDTQHHVGFWRYLTIRSSVRTQQLMLIVVHASPTAGGAGNAETEGTEEKEDTKMKRLLFEQERTRFINLFANKDLKLPHRDGLPEVAMKQAINPEAADSTNGDSGGADAVMTTARTASSSTPGSASTFRVTSIFFQEYNGLSNPNANDAVQHVYGEHQFIEERVGKNTYQISPGAFFQVTTRGAEVLYNVVRDRIRDLMIENIPVIEPAEGSTTTPLNVDQKTTTNPKKLLMFDVCCGTGTIGLHCLSEGVVDRVVGIDISKPAIEDAIANAKRNGFNHQDVCRFVASRAEHAMSNEIRRLHKNTETRTSTGGIVAVVDPARDGLHPDVIRSIRATTEIQRLIYVSCNPTGSLVNDAALLCGPASKKYTGTPFVPVRAQPVDMFPLTNHCEMVLTFDRMKEEDEEKKVTDEKSKSNQMASDKEVKEQRQEQEQEHNESTVIT